MTTVVCWQNTNSKWCSQDSLLTKLRLSYRLLHAQCGFFKTLAHAHQITLATLLIVYTVGITGKRYITLWICVIYILQTLYTVFMMNILKFGQCRHKMNIYNIKFEFKCAWLLYYNRAGKRAWWLLTSQVSFADRTPYFVCTLLIYFQCCNNAWCKRCINCYN